MTDDGTGMHTVPLVIALFNGNHGESPMRVDTQRTMIWDEERCEVVLALSSPDHLDWWRTILGDAIDVAFQTPSQFGEIVPGPDNWTPPGWSESP